MFRGSASPSWLFTGEIRRVLELLYVDVVETEDAVLARMGQWSVPMR